MLRYTLWLLVFSFLIGCKTVSVPTTKSTEVTSDYRSLELWATYYYVPTFRHDENGVPLLDKNENEWPLKLDPTDWCTAAIQGSVYIMKNDTLHLARYGGRSQHLQFDCRSCPKYKNYPGYELTGKVRWVVDDSEITGGSGLKLVPMKSLAVDPFVIPYQSVVYIPEAVGTPYINENGETVIHDGYFLAADTGSMIKGNHIDVYLGTVLKNPFSFVKSDSDQGFTAYVVHDERKRFELMYLHQ